MERLGVAFTGGLQPKEIVECVRLAEELGYESAWMAEGHGGDQFSILTACAVATKRILLGTSISSVFVRSAPTIAMAAACVDHYSDGRFILGLGSSHKVQVEPEHGLTFTQPVQRLRETVDIVRLLLRDGVVSYSGTVFNISKFDIPFQPFRKEIPIHMAAVRPKMLQICGEIAQGAMLTWSTLEHVKTAAENVAQGAKQAGKDPKDVEVSTLLHCAVSDDKEKAGYPLRVGIASYAGFFPRYRRLMVEAGFPDEIEAVRQAWVQGDRERAIKLVPSELIDKIGVVGTATECRKKIQDFREAGITLPIVFPTTTGEDRVKNAMHVIQECRPQK